MSDTLIVEDVKKEEPKKQQKKGPTRWKCPVCKCYCGNPHNRKCSLLEKDGDKVGQHHSKEALYKIAHALPENKRRLPPNSKAKGSAFERDICRKLSLWVTLGTKHDVLWRSGGSGSMGTKGTSTNQFGDICSVDPLGEPLVQNFVVECKNYADAKLGNSIYQRPGSLLFRWWKTLLRDVAKAEEATKLRKIPLLIIKEKRRPALVATDIMGMARFHNISPICCIATPLKDKDGNYFHTYIYTLRAIIGTKAGDVFKSEQELQELTDKTIEPKQKKRTKRVRLGKSGKRKSTRERLN